MHKSITAKRVMNLVQLRERSLENPGLCTSCGKRANNCEPDAREYECRYCHKKTVYGAEELLFVVR